MDVLTREFSAGRIPPRPSLLDQPGFEVRNEGGQAYSLRLWGQLVPGWARGLALGLYHAGIRVERGFARRVEGEAWLVDFEVVALDDAVDPVLLDYLSLARSGTPAAIPRTLLSDFSISHTPKHEGALHLEVRAPDRLGFLGGLLARIEATGLLPEEMSVDTRGTPVLDRFFLKAAGRTVPGDDHRRALEAELSRLVLR